MPTRNHGHDRPSKSFEEQSRHEASSFFSGVAEKTQDAASYLGEKAEQATDAVGAGMESAGSAIREHGPASGAFHNAGESLATKLEEGGRYLEHQGLQGVGEDVTNLIRRNPIPALLIGLGVGVLLAQLIRR